MSSSHCGHLFIFHDDDESRPVTLQADEVVVAGNPGDENRVPYRKQYSPSASETESIRSQSAYLDGFIRRNPTLSTHLWPNQLRGISQSSLYHVIRSLTGSTGAPPPQGLNQLQDLSSICQVIWILQCRWEPFQRAASIILRSYDGKEVNEAEAKCLTMITFVLRRDDELKTHLQNLLWLSDATLDLPIEYLRDWVNDRRKENLEIVYDFFHEQICRLHGKYKNSEAMSKIYFDLTENADRSGIRVDFGDAWSTHRNSRRILLDMSPDKLAGDVLSIIVREVGKPGGDLNGVTEDASDIEARSSGQRGGRGGDIWEFVISMLPRIGRRRIEQGAIPAIYDVVKTGTERRTEWRELIDPKGQKFGRLLSWRNAEQDRWFVVPANANGHPAQPSNSP